MYCSRMVVALNFVRSLWLTGVNFGYKEIMQHKDCKNSGISHGFGL